MSKEVMVIDQPDFLEREDLDARSALRSVYSSYGFRFQDEIPAHGSTLIVATQAAGETSPQPISRADYFADALDPVRGKVSAGRKNRMNLRRFARQGNMLVFFFDHES